MKSQTAIPHTFHWIWPRSKPLHPQHALFMAGWLQHHPGWHVRVWDEPDMDWAWKNKDYAKGLKCPGRRSDAMRVELLRKFGGVYLDVDFECLRNIEPWLEREVLLSYHSDLVPGLLSNAIMAAVPEHPFFEMISEKFQEDAESHPGSTPHSTGPYMINRMYGEFSPTFDVVTNPHIFFPFDWTQQPKYYPETVAAHHWARTWHAESPTP